jgi:hypothetical protein
VEEYLESLKGYLERGGFFNTFKTTRDNLREKTISGYLSSIRKYLEAIVQGIHKKIQSQGMLIVKHFCLLFQ